MLQPPYVTREAVKAALDIALTARRDSQVDGAIASSARSIEGDLHGRRLYPQYATRSFDWPSLDYSRSWRLWLDGNTLISVTTMTSGGVTLVEGTDFILRRSDDRDEPPYTHIEILLSSTAAFSSGDTHQEAIVIEGLWGWTDDQIPAGALAAAIGDTTGTQVDVADGSLVDVGHLLRVDDERMIVTARQMIDSGQNLGADLDSQKNDQQVAVADGTGYSVGEELLVDAERMLIDEIAGNNLIVRRAWNGSTLAAHTSGADVYASRRLTVERGSVGSTPAIHSGAATITAWNPPGLLRAWGKAEAIVTFEQETGAYARTIGEGENTREAAGRGLADIRRQAMTAYARKARKAAV